ncbi:MAG: hypothetical protein GY787_04165 [Alteromonadales bacterium]|nr:hypothetical protein [Alteromonadales bacterium]
MDFWNLIDKQNLSCISKLNNISSDLNESVEYAKSFINAQIWCDQITDSYLGLYEEGIIAIVLFKIESKQSNVDDCIWSITGDIPPAYITCDSALDPISALDGYIGAMDEWVEAVQKGESVDELIPVNVAPTEGDAEMLKSRLDLLFENIVKPMI